MVASTRDLGVVIDSKFAFKEHNDSIILRARRTLGVIIRSGKELTAHTLGTLFKTLVRPILEYNSVIWAPYFDLHINRLEKVQRVSVNTLGELAFKTKVQMMSTNNLVSKALSLADK